jgi:hypothetical protein
MPAYDYLCDETGEMLEVIKPMTEAPKIGHRLRRNGKTFRRIPPGKVVANVAPEYSFESPQVALYHPDAPYHNAEGEACFRTKNEVREFCAKTQGDGVDLGWHMHGRK